MRQIRPRIVYFNTGDIQEDSSPSGSFWRPFVLEGLGVSTAFAFSADLGTFLEDIVVATAIRLSLGGQVDSNFAFRAPALSNLFTFHSNTHIRNKR